MRALDERPPPVVEAPPQRDASDFIGTVKPVRKPRPPVAPADERGRTPYERFAADLPRPFANASAWLVGESGRRLRPRWLVLGLCCAIATISSLDRVMMSVAILPMSDELLYSDTTKGLVAAAFTTGYFACFVPAGVLAATSSPTVTLTAGLLVWSAAQAATPAAAYASLDALLGCRALMGLGEATTFPSIQALAARWVPEQYRSRFWGLLSACFNSGTVTAYALSPAVIEMYGWPGAFRLFGGAGVVLCALWAAVGRDGPSERRDDWQGDECPVPAEGSVAAGAADTGVWARAKLLPWGDIATSRPVWGLTAASVASNSFLYFALAWLPSYFNYEYALDVAASSSASALPFAAAALACAVAGAAADALVARQTPLSDVRKAMQGVATLGPAAALLALGTLGRGVLPYETAEALFVGALGLHAFSVAGYAVGVQDISRKSASLISGTTSGIGVMSGALTQYATGALLDANGRDFVPVFLLAAAVQVLGFALFTRWWSSEKVFE